MKIKNNKKILLTVGIFIFGIFLLNSSFSNIVFAEINNSYSEGAETSVDLTQTHSDILLEGIAGLVYALAKLVEFFVTNLMNLLTGSEVFPWADKVVFNAMPILDINFINPSEGSLFYGNNPFGNIVKNMYYTLFVISLSFFGVVVGIMAIRLAISSIADEKGKYKKAIQDWLFALIMIFTAHYLMSFIFFVNEKMVEVATAIFMEKVKSLDFSISSSVYTSYSDDDVDTVIENFIDTATNGKTPDDFEYDEYISSMNKYSAAIDVINSGGKVFYDKNDTYHYKKDNIATTKLVSEGDYLKQLNANASSYLHWRTAVEYVLPKTLTGKDFDIVGALTFRLGDKDLGGGLYYQVKPSTLYTEAKRLGDDLILFKQEGNQITQAPTGDTVSTETKHFLENSNFKSATDYTTIWKRYMFYLIMNDNYSNARKLSTTENEVITSWIFNIRRYRFI